MGPQDNALEYHTYYDDIKKLLDELSTLNFNINDYENKLTEINNQLAEEINQKILPLDFVYQKATKDLIKLQYNISTKYEFYYKMNNLIKYLETEITHLEDIPLTKLQYLINDVKRYLRDMRNSTTIEFTEEENLFKRLYDVTYILIKKEIELTETSSLLAYINENEIDASLISDRVEEEIDKIDLTQNEEIASLKYKISSKQWPPIYTDLELIKEIVYLENKKKNKIPPALQKVSEEIKENNQRITSELNITKELTTDKMYKNQIELAKNSIRKSRKTIATRIISIILSLTTTIGAGFYLVPKIKIFKNYDKVTYTYVGESETPEISHEDILVATINDIKIVMNGDFEHNDLTRVIYQESTPYYKNTGLGSDGKYRRQETTYDLSDIELKEHLDYLELDLEKLGRTPTEETTVKEELTPEDLYQETIKQLMIEVIDENNYETNEDANLSLYIDIVILIHLLLTRKKKDYRLIGQLKTIKKELKDIKNNKRNKKETKKQLKELYKKLSKLIKNDEKLKSEFNAIYEELHYSFKKDEVEKLYNEVNGIDYSNSIELPANIFKGRAKEKVKK